MSISELNYLAKVPNKIKITWSNRSLGARLQAVFLGTQRKELVVVGAGGQKSNSVTYTQFGFILFFILIYLKIILEGYS